MPTSRLVPDRASLASPHNVMAMQLRRISGGDFADAELEGVRGM